MGPWGSIYTSFLQAGKKFFSLASGLLLLRSTTTYYVLASHHEAAIASVSARPGVPRGQHGRRRVPQPRRRRGRGARARVLARARAALPLPAPLRGRAPAEAARRRWLRRAVWLLSAALTAAFTRRVAGAMPTAGAVLVWAMSAATAGGGFYALVVVDDGRDLGAK